MAYTTTTSDPCVTQTVPYTTYVPTYTTYVTDVDVVTTVPGYTTISTYTTCSPPYSTPCYTTYYTTSLPPYPATTHVYTTITSSTYSPSVTYNYTTSCPCPTGTDTYYSTACPTTYTPTYYTTPAYPTTTYLSKRSLSNDQASFAPVVVGVARALGIVALLGLLIYYFLFKRAASKASRRLRLGESDRKENFSDQYGPMEAGRVPQYVQEGQYSRPSVRAAHPPQHTELVWEAESNAAKGMQFPQQSAT